MAKNRVITVQGIPVTVSYEDIDDYICITDIAAAKSDNSRAADVLRNWLRNRMSDGTLWEGQTALYFRWTCLPDGAVPELAAGFSRNDRRLS